MNTEEIYNIINEKRLDARLTIKQLCDKANLSYMAWTYIKSGKYNLQTLEKICLALNIHKIVIKFNVN